MKWPKLKKDQIKATREQQNKQRSEWDVEKGHRWKQKYSKQIERKQKWENEDDLNRNNIPNDKMIVLKLWSSNSDSKNVLLLCVGLFTFSLELILSQHIWSLKTDGKRAHPKRCRIHKMCTLFTMIILFTVAAECYYCYCTCILHGASRQIAVILPHLANNHSFLFWHFFPLSLKMYNICHVFSARVTIICVVHSNHTMDIPKYSFHNFRFLLAKPKKIKKKKKTSFVWTNGD